MDATISLLILMLFLSGLYTLLGLLAMLIERLPLLLARPPQRADSVTAYSRSALQTGYHCSRTGSAD